MSSPRVYGLFFVLLWSSVLAGCSVNEAITKDLPPERAQECVRNCEKLGMKLGAVVLMMNSAGCVCEPVEAAPPAAPTSKAARRAAVLAGAAAIHAAQEAANQQQQQNQTSSPPPKIYTPPR